MQSSICPEGPILLQTMQVFSTEFLQKAEFIGTGIEGIGTEFLYLPLMYITGWKKTQFLLVGIKVAQPVHFAVGMVFPVCCQHSPVDLIY